MKNKKPKVSDREKILSWLSCLIGGWNGSAGVSAGRLHFEPDYDNDEKIINFLLERHKSDCQYKLKQENIKLKARLFDLLNK